MGDRFTLNHLSCGHCKAKQEDVYYAPSSGFLSHICDKCGGQNIIDQGFHLTPATKEEVEEHYKLNGFE